MYNVSLMHLKNVPSLWHKQFFASCKKHILVKNFSKYIQNFSFLYDSHLTLAKKVARPHFFSTLANAANTYLESWWRLLFCLSPFLRRPPKKPSKNPDSHSRRRLKWNLILENSAKEREKPRELNIVAVMTSWIESMSCKSLPNQWQEWQIATIKMKWQIF